MQAVLNFSNVTQDYLTGLYLYQGEYFFLPGLYLLQITRLKKWPVSQRRPEKYNSYIKQLKKQGKVFRVDSFSLNKFEVEFTVQTIDKINGILIASK